MSKYALIFGSHLTLPHVADQLMVMDYGYNYIEGEPCVSIDTSDIEVYSPNATVKLNGEVVGHFPAKKLRSAECFILPITLLAPQAEQEAVYLDIPYELSIKTAVSITETGFKCFGAVEVNN